MSFLYFSLFAVSFRSASINLLSNKIIRSANSLSKTIYAHIEYNYIGINKAIIGLTRSLS
jgi:hypothetical protein